MSAEDRAGDSTAPAPAAQLEASTSASPVNAPAALIPFLAGLSTLGPLSNDLFLPSMPLVSTALGVRGGVVQLSLSALMIGFSLGALIYGPLSDRYGRKPLLTIGLLIYVVASLLCAQARSLEWLIVARGLQGLGAAAAMVLGRVIILDRWQGADASRAISMVAMFTFLTPVLAPIAGGYVAAWGEWAAVFWIQAGAGLLCLAVTAWLLPRVKRRRDGSVLRSIMAYGTILRDRQAIGYMVCSAFGFVGVIAFVSNSAFVMMDYFGLQPHHYGYAFAAVMLGGSIGSYFNGRLVRGLGISKMIGFGSALLAVGGSGALAVAIAGGTLYALMVPMLVYMFGVGFVFANTMARTLTRFPSRAGAASSLFGVNQFLIGALVSAALSLEPHPTPLPLASTLAVAGLGCAALWWGWLRHESAVPLRHEAG